MFVAILPKMSVSSFIRYLKGKSSVIFHERHGNLKFKYENRLFGCRGYYADTVRIECKANSRVHTKPYEGRSNDAQRDEGPVYGYQVAIFRRWQTCTCIFRCALEKWSLGVICKATSYASGYLLQYYIILVVTFVITISFSTSFFLIVFYMNIKIRKYNINRTTYERKCIMRNIFLSEFCEVHKLWIITKQLSLLINYLATNFYLNKDIENCSGIWELIAPKIMNFFDCVSNENAIGIIISEKKWHDLQEKNIWQNYEELIGDLSILLMIKDYNIVQDYDLFIKELYEHLICFESEVRKCCSAKSTYLSSFESSMKI